MWRGQLTVPEPGGYRVEADSTAPVTIHVDGRFLERGDRLAAGTHDLLVQTHRMSPRFRLVLYWSAADEPRQVIPREAFSPPAPPAS